MHTCRYSGGSHDDDQGRGRRRCKEMRRGRATSLRPSPKAAPTQTQKLQEDWYLICSPQSPPQSTKGQPPCGETLWNGGVINVGGASRHVQREGRQATVKTRQHVLQPPALAGIPRGQRVPGAYLRHKGAAEGRRPPRGLCQLRKVDPASKRLGTA